VTPDAVYDPAAFRRLAEGVTALAAGYLARDEAADVTTRLAPAELARRFDEPLPREGTDADALLERWRTDVLPQCMRLAHPRYVGHQVASPLPGAAAVEPLVSLVNNSLAVWEMSPVYTVLERRVLAWFAAALGWPTDEEDADAAGGSFVSGGAVGNLTGLAAARARALPDAWTAGVDAARARPALVTSSAAHYSVERAAGVLGLGTDAVVATPHVAGRLDPARAGAAIDRARAEGRAVVALVACAGSTAIGAVDDLRALGAVARERRVWLHVDAAHAGAFLLSERLRPLLAGLEQADSVCVDLHKMGFQPLSTALVLVRRRRDLAGAFRQTAPYLFHGADEAERWNLGGQTLQCSRRGDAARAWLALKLYGARGIADPR